MIHCPVCGRPAKAMTTETVKAKLVTVYHHDTKRCREFENPEDGR